MGKNETELNVNNVDTSPEKIDQEWDEIAGDEKINPADSPADKGADHSAQAEPLDQDKTAERLGSFLKRFVRWGFGRFAPGWKVTDDESGSLADAWSAVIVKHLPINWLRFVPGGGASIELDAIMITIEIIEPRLSVPANSEKNPGQAAPAVSKGSLKHSEPPRKKPEKQSGVMAEVHDL